MTQERCERIRTLSPDRMIAWAVALKPTSWTANLMSKDTFDYIIEHMELEGIQAWPSQIYEILSGLATEEPLKGCQAYHTFLSGMFWCCNKRDYQLIPS